jgi:hypothetical protein
MDEMEVKLNQEEINAAINEAVSGAVKQGLDAFEFKHEVSAAVSAAVGQAQIPRLIGEELERRLRNQTEEIVSAVADEVMPAVRTAFAGCFKSAMTAMVYGLMQGKPSYMGEPELKLWDEAMRSLDPMVSDKEA